MFFTNLYIKKNLAEEEYQKELIVYLELEGVRVELQPQDWTAKLPKWLQPHFQNFASVSVSYSLADCIIGEEKLNMRLLAAISEFDVIHSLNISASKSNDDLIEEFFVELLNNVQNPSKVRELDVAGTFLTAKIFSYFKDYSGLRSLSIAGKSIPHEALLAFPRMKDLMFFRCLTGSRYTKEEFKHIVQSKKLKELSLQNYGVDQADTDLTPLLKGLKDLEYLRITGNCSKLDLSEIPSLKTMAFYHYVENTDAILEALHASKADFPGEEIIIGNQVTNKGLKYIPNKWELTITNSSLDLDLINWEELQKLERLNLPVGTDIKKIIPHLEKLKNLRSFSCPELDFKSDLYMELENRGINVYRAFRSKIEKPLTRRKMKSKDKLIEKLSLEVVRLTVEDVKTLASFKNLRVLKLKCSSGLDNLNSLSAEKLSRLEVEFLHSPQKRLTGLANLNYLSIIGHKPFSLKELIDVDSLGQLKSLDLDCPKNVLIDLSGIDSLSSLKSLKFSGRCQVEGASDSLEEIEFDFLPDAADFWAAVGNIELLKTVKGQFIGDDKAFMNLLPAAVKFTELNLRYASIRKNETLDHIRKFKNVEVLHLPPEEMTAEQALSIFRSLKNLKKVYLRIGLSKKVLKEAFPEIEFFR